MKNKRLKKSIDILIIMLIVATIVFAVILHFNPHLRLVGAWQGDGTLDLLGESPFDGAVELRFFINKTGYVVTENGKTDFTYDIYSYDKTRERNTVVLHVSRDFRYGQQFFLEGKTFNIYRYEETVTFTRK